MVVRDFQNTEELLRTRQSLIGEGPHCGGGVPAEQGLLRSKSIDRFRPLAVCRSSEKAMLEVKLLAGLPLASPCAYRTH
jgi:hypothetical protein